MNDAVTFVNDYSRKNAKACWLLFTAANDYASARCLLLNGLVNGLVLGAQAIEKFLKAYILFLDPAKNVRAANHSIEHLLRELLQLSDDVDFSSYFDVARKFDIHYASRYPDNKLAFEPKSSSDLVELDDFVVFINEHLPCPKNVKCRTGLYAFLAISSESGFVPPYERWIKIQNASLNPIMSRIIEDYRAVMVDLHPEHALSRGWV